MQQIARTVIMAIKLQYLGTSFIGVIRELDQLLESEKCALSSEALEVKTELEKKGIGLTAPNSEYIYVNFRLPAFVYRTPCSISWRL